MEFLTPTVRPRIVKAIGYTDDSSNVREGMNVVIVTGTPAEVGLSWQSTLRARMHKNKYNKSTT